MRIVGLFVYIIAGALVGAAAVISMHSVPPLHVGAILGAIAGLLVGGVAWIRAERGA